MILLDTNVISALMQRSPDATVARWVDSQPQTSIWTTSVTIFELRVGLESMAEGKRRSQLLLTLDIVLTQVIQQRVAAFDGPAAEQAAALAVSRKKAGRSGDLRDTMIAAIALSTRATVATRNVKHFDDIASTVVNPFASSV